MASGEPLPPPEGDPINVTQLQAGLSALKTRVATHRYAFPPVCRQLLDDTIAAMEQVIAFVAANGHADAELRSVAAMLTDYLPTSLDTYLRLPKDYAERNPDGRTAAEELELQLRLLRDSAKDAVGSLYRGDALQLQQQSAFLESKFGTSELDLDR